MKFVSEHLTRHHLLHKPHRWFLAFLLSPIHFLEWHYQQKYHLKFSHARKLFIFDMLLLASIFVIGGLATFWYFYDPTITKLVDLKLEVAATEPNPDQAGRVLSGEDIILIAAYQNNSQVDLIDPVLHFNLPPGFLLTQVESGTYVTSTGSVTLKTARPKTGAEVKLTGRFFAAPNTDTKFAAELVYHQPSHTNYEVRGASLLGITRGSVLTATITAPDTIYSQGTFDSQLVVKNIYRTNSPAAEIRVTTPDHTTIQFKNPSTGEIKNNTWQLPALTAGQSATSSVAITTNLPAETKELLLDFTPIVTINSTDISQTPATMRAKVVRPDITISSSWEKTKLAPGQSSALNITVANTGDITLNDVALNISLPSNINAIALRANNPYPIKNNALMITSKEISELATLLPGQSKVVSVTIPIINFPTGQTDLNLNVPIRTSARTKASPVLFEKSYTTPGLPIGTSLRLIPDAHYYSLEGDQLGRGPLPPKVGKETKYWALLTLQNGTSETDTVSMSATLAPGVTFTGKSNVSRGREPIYNASTRTLTWQTNDLPAHESAQINVELAITPTEAQRGTIPLLLTNIHASAHDNFINEIISSGNYNLDASLNSDDFAQEKGVRVQ